MHVEALKCESCCKVYEPRNMVMQFGSDRKYYRTKVIIEVEDNGMIDLCAECVGKLMSRGYCRAFPRVAQDQPCPGCVEAQEKVFEEGIDKVICGDCGTSYTKIKCTRRNNDG